MRVVTGLVRSAQQYRRGFSYSPLKSQTEATSVLPGVLIFGTLGVGYYIYRDPDVLPESIRQYLPIQENHSMTLEEYEAWRAHQSGEVTQLPSLNDKVQAPTDAILEELEANKGPEANPQEVLDSLKRLLEEIKQSETQFKLELKEMKAKENRWKNTLEENEQLESYTEQIQRINDQIKFVKKHR